jgi:hypothetical protein
VIILYNGTFTNEGIYNSNLIFNYSYGYTNNKNKNLSIEIPYQFNITKVEKPKLSLKNNKTFELVSISGFSFTNESISSLINITNNSNVITSYLSAEFIDIDANNYGLEIINPSINTDGTIENNECKFSGIATQCTDEPLNGKLKIYYFYKTSNTETKFKYVEIEQPITLNVGIHFAVDVPFGEQNSYFPSYFIPESPTVLYNKKDPNVKISYTTDSFNVRNGFGNLTTIQNFWALYNNTLTQDNLMGYYNDYLIKTDFYFNHVNGFEEINIDLKQNKYYINSIMDSDNISEVPTELLNVVGTYVWNENESSWYCSETDFYITRHALSDSARRFWYNIKRS